MRQAALVPVAGIAVHDAFRDHAIDEALRIAQHFGSGVIVAGGDRLVHVLDGGAHGGAQPHVVDAALHRLVGALARGLDVCHEGVGSGKGANSSMNLMRAVAMVSSLTFVSRVLGCLRDFIIARAFGASFATDAFFVAFRIPNLLRRLFAEGALSQAFVPVLAEHKNKGSTEEVRSLIDGVATLLLIALVVVAALGMAVAPIIVYISAPGFAADSVKFGLTVTMLRITFPYIAFISLVAFAAGILNTWNRFSLPAITPAMLNIAFIVGALFFADYFDPPILVLAWAVFVGGALQLMLQIPTLARLGLLPRPRLDWSHPGVRRMLKLMAPAAFGVSISQVSLLINTIFASFLVSGSVSWLYYADRLMEFPAGGLGVALGSLFLPGPSEGPCRARHAEYGELLDWGLRLAFLQIGRAHV